MIKELLSDPATRVILCCGAGGVGKTTTAAAIALQAADQGRKTVVLTIDPARRLAQALGLNELSFEPHAVKAVPNLYAMQLDMKRTFDEIVLAHADAERARTILENPFYISLSSSFAGTQEYMAMEKLGQLLASQEWDLIVVDTPPSRSALDFLDAPARLGSFLDGRLIKFLTTPAKAGGWAITRILNTGIQLFASTISKILGGQILTDISAFVSALDSVFGGFRKRADETYQLLKAPGSAFLVVAVPEREPIREAEFFIDRLNSEGMPLAGVIVNRVSPSLAPLTISESKELQKSASPALRTALELHIENLRAQANEERLIKTIKTPALVRIEDAGGEISDIAGLRSIDLAGKSL
ncbi:MAG: ArsA family ATPase [Actinobacteria bacterium]|nr:ArsA family ATPase [Actinomycetota bacterium]NBP91696.1 ArsA family ATPase [Actinomycetota bacterium]